MFQRQSANWLHDTGKDGWKTAERHVGQFLVIAHACFLQNCALDSCGWKSMDFIILTEQVLFSHFFGGILTFVEIREFWEKFSKFVKFRLSVCGIRQVSTSSHSGINGIPRGVTLFTISRRRVPSRKTSSRAGGRTARDLGSYGAISGRK